MSAEQRLIELGIELPTPMTPAGNYVAAVRSGSLLYLSGSGTDPRRRFGDHRQGGRHGVAGGGGGGGAADRAAAAAAIIRRELGSLDQVRQVVKTLGMVNGAPGFNRTPAVIDGCSNLMIEVFGDAGRGARSAVGMAELPFDIAVEIEMIVEVDD